TPRYCAYALLPTTLVQVTVELRLLHADVTLWVFVEPIFAAHRAEIVGFSLVLAGGRRCRRINLHPTDRISCQCCLTALHIVRLHRVVALSIERLSNSWTPRLPRSLTAQPERPHVAAYHPR